jgi:hypothetical protein
MEVVAPLDPDHRDPPGEFRSVQYVTDLNQSTPASYTQDVVNVPPALVDGHGNPMLGPDGLPAAPGKVVLRVRFADYLGTYVEHCHRFPHEDRGMMSLVRTIPHDPVFTVARPDAPTVSIVRSSDSQPIAELTPFEGAASLQAAVGDVDGDTIPDVAVASGAGPTTTVQVRSGRSNYEDVLFEVEPFGGDESGANVALGDLNADGQDDVVVAQRARTRGRVAIFDSRRGKRLADFTPYDRVTEGVSVATGLVDEGGRLSLVTGAGAGGRPTVDVYNFDLFGDGRGRFPSRRSLQPLRVARFDGAKRASRGGVLVTTGYPFASEGGFASVLTTTARGPAELRAFTISSHGHQEDVAASGSFRPHDYRPRAPREATLRATVDLDAGSETPPGATVAALSTTTGSELVVASPGGGPLSVWASGSPGAPISFVRTLPFEGVAVAAI